MERFQIYDRRKGAWSSYYELEVGYVENWVQDKTTDSAKDIVIRIKGEQEPDIRILDWTRIVYLEDAQCYEIVDRKAKYFQLDGKHLATYTADGLPDNHSQYIVCGVKKVYSKTNNFWTVSLELLEPIERARGILGESLTYTNQTSKTVEHEDKSTTTYVKDPYNHYTALERWLKVTPANCDSYATGYDRAKNISWFNRVRIPDSEWLSTIPFADTTFNELTLYNVLMDNYDSSTGRTPVFYFDMNTATDLPHNKDRDEYILKFERQDGFDKPVLDFDELTMNADDIMCSEVIDNYATGLASNVKNLSAGTVVTFPAENLFAVPEVDADVRDTTGYNQDASDYWIIRTPFPIKRVVNIEELEVSGYNIYGYATDFLIKRITRDVSNNVLERQQYLAKGGIDYDPTKDKNIVWYAENDSKIHIKKYKYVSQEKSGAVNMEGTTTCIYRVKYEPLINSRVQIGNSEFVQQVNQSSAQVDSKKYGGFLSEMLKSMGKADISFGKNYSGSPKRFQHLIGSRIKRGDREYLITNMSYRNRRFQYYVAFQLNENHVRKNSSYQAPQTVRADIAISTDSVKERMSSIQQIIKIGLTPQVAEGNQFLADKGAAISSLTENMGSVNYPQVALIETSNTLIKSNGEHDLYTKNLLATLARVKLGNSVVFNVCFYDNAEAGKSKISEARTFEGSKPYTTYSHFPFGEVKSQLPVLYTDPFGDVEQCKVYLTRLNDNKFPDIDGRGASDYWKKEYNDTREMYKLMQGLPTPSAEQIESLIQNKSLQVSDLNIKKDQLEKFCLSVQIDYSSNDIVICDDLLLNSRLMRDSYSTRPVMFTYDERRAEKDDLKRYLRKIEFESILVSDNFIEYKMKNAFTSDEVCGMIGTVEKSFLIINKVLPQTFRIYFA